MDDRPHVRGWTIKLLGGNRGEKPYPSGLQQRFIKYNIRKTEY